VRAADGLARRRHEKELEAWLVALRDTAGV
jgi:hypothetical protein